MWRSTVDAILLLSTVLAGGCGSFESRPLEPEAELRALLARADTPWTVVHTRPRGEENDLKAQAFEPSDGLDEDELAALAVSRNPDLVARRIAVGEAESLLVKAGLLPNPEVGFAWRPTIGGPGATFEADLLWEIVRPWERSARKGAAAARIDEARAAVAAAEWELDSRVRAAHLDLLHARGAARLIHDEVSLLEKVARLVKDGRAIGERTDLDVALAELDLAESRREASRADTRADAKHRELLHVLGLPPGTALALAEAGAPLRVRIVDGLGEEEVRRRLVSCRFELRAKESEHTRAEEELRLAVYRQFPRIHLGPSYEREAGGSPTLGLGLLVEVPLFDRNQGEIAEKEKARDRIHAEYVALLHDTLARATDALERMRAARVEVEAEEKEVLPLLDRSQDLLEAAFRARELSLADWVTARQRALRARLEHLRTLARYRKSLIDLEAATGARLAAPLPPQGDGIEPPAPEAPTPTP